MIELTKTVERPSSPYTHVAGFMQGIPAEFSFSANEINGHVRGIFLDHGDAFFFSADDHEWQEALTALRG